MGNTLVQVSEPTFASAKHITAASLPSFPVNAMVAHPEVTTDPVKKSQAPWLGRHVCLGTAIANLPPPKELSFPTDAEHDALGWGLLHAETVTWSCNEAAAG